MGQGFVLGLEFQPVQLFGSLVSTAAQPVRKPATSGKPRSLLERVSPSLVLTKLEG